MGPYLVFAIYARMLALGEPVEVAGPRAIQFVVDEWESSEVSMGHA